MKIKQKILKFMRNQSRSWFHGHVPNPILMLYLQGAQLARRQAPGARPPVQGARRLVPGAQRR